MKKLFIFLSILFFGLGCAHQKSVNPDNPEPILRAEAEEWRASAPGQNEFTEHGVDFSIELQEEFSDIPFSFIIYDGRKSFPATTETTESGTVLVHARVLIESDLLAETSVRSDLTDRLVFQTEDGTTDFIPVNSWIQKPLAYR